MKRMFLGVLLLAAFGLFLGYVPKSDNSEKMIAAAKKLDQQFMTAYNNRDAAAIMACYWNSPELVSYPPDALEVHGWQAAKEGLEEAFAHMPPDAKLELTESSYKVAGDVVIGWGKWRMTMRGPEGEAMTMDGRYTDVKAERDSKWVLIHDHASVPMAPPPPPDEDAEN